MARIYPPKPFALASAAPQLTDWIPCTTPPVRDGEYELRMADTHGTEARAAWENGQWVWKYSGDVAQSPNNSERRHRWVWRGVRRWVLTVSALAPQEPCDYVEQDRAYVAHVSKRGVLYLTDKLIHPYSSTYKYSAALSFATETDAVAYATSHARHLRGWKVVLA